MTRGSEVGERVREARRVARLSRVQLASQVGFGAETLGKIERGERPLHDYEASAIEQSTDADDGFLLTGKGSAQGNPIQVNQSPLDAGPVTREVLAQLAALRADVQSLSATVERLAGDVEVPVRSRAAGRPRSQRNT